MTDNHDYRTPAKGESDWHLPLNRNFRNLDSDVELRDAETNLSDYEPKQGAKFLATDSGRVYIGDGESWHQLASTGHSPTFSSIDSTRISSGSVSAREISGTVYARHFDGSTLSEKVKNAIDSLPNGRGRVRVTPKANGEAWEWRTLRINPLDYNGVEIDLDHNVEIRCTSPDWAITVDTDGDMNGNGRRLRLTGGIWKSEATDPVGWCRIIDAIENHVIPNRVERFRNSTNSSTCISIENHDSWSEANLLSGTFEGDRIIDFVPASITGGSGTDSFHDTKIERLTANIHEWGIRLRGKVQYCHFDKPTLFAKDDDVVGFVLGSGWFDATTVQSMKFEDTVGFENTYGVRTTDGYDDWRPPLFVGGKPGGVGISGTADLADPNHAVPWICPAKRSHKITHMGQSDGLLVDKDGMSINGSVLAGREDGVAGTVQLNDQEDNEFLLDTNFGYLFIDSDGLRQAIGNDAVTWENRETGEKCFRVSSDGTAEGFERDLTADGAPAPSTFGVVAVHDGSSGHAAGRYESDPSNGRWVGLGVADGESIPYP